MILIQLLRHLWGQARMLGKVLPKEGLCQHFNFIQLWTYLGGTPRETCRVCKKEWGFNFIEKKWEVV